MLSRVIFPPPNSLFITVMSMASLSLSVLGLFEGLGKNFEYSKFSNLNVERSASKRNNTVCSRNGMLAAYLPAFLAAVTFSGLFPNVGLRFLLVNSALTMHFFKRILEDHSLASTKSLRRRGNERSVMAMVVSILSRIAFPPPVTCLLVRVMPVACLLFSVIGVFEGLGKNFQYSKFLNLNVDKSTSRQIRVSSTIAMLTAYTPSFLSATAFSWQLPNVDIPSKCSLSSSLVLEVLFVHKYSGGMAVGTVITITLGYFTTTSITIFALSLTQGFPEPPVDLKYLGVVLFLVGIVGNFYHHLLLASLRTKNEKGYKVPKGGLFGRVACPHYFFEILIFLGICFISQTLYSFASTISTVCYLMGRSYATRRWYLTKFDDFPKDVKAIIPYVF
uniref:3-oxo-5-alpha-steroid 4-dehydrogenase C-terminal domain-containing protein n=1 Tax=Salix viminalis TaxID=40686 RepID=A0A6N2LRL8_SALVM